MESKPKRKTKHQKIIDRLDAIEYRQNILFSNIFNAVKVDISSGKRKILLKGRVDELEKAYKKLKL